MACICFGWTACSGSDEEPPCEVGEGECPNACTTGEALEGAVCEGPEDCACGFFCKAGTCSFYQGDYRGCLCEGVEMAAPGLPILGLGSHMTDELVIEVHASNALIASSSSNERLACKSWKSAKSSKSFKSSTYSKSSI